jgi:hypothetical protein
VQNAKDWGLMVVGFRGKGWRKVERVERVEGGRLLEIYWELTGNCQRLMGLMGL